MTITHTISRFSILAAALLALSACSDCWPCTSGSYSTDDTIVSPSYSKSFLQLAPVAPPAQKVEELPEPDSPRTTAWRPGYWQWGGSDYYWVSAETIDRPSPTAVWSPDHWIQHTYGWAFVPGYWQ